MSLLPVGFESTSQRERIRRTSEQFDGVDESLTIGVALVLAEVRTKDVTRVIERNVD